MGNVFSSASAGDGGCDNVISESEINANMDSNENEENFQDAIDEDDARAKAREDEMTEFRRQLNEKREQRREILARHRAGREELEKSLHIERNCKVQLEESNRQLRQLLIKNNIVIPDDLQSENSELTDTINQMKEQFDKLRSDNNKLRRDLVDSNSALQGAYSDIADLHVQNKESIKQINALKEVIAVSKTMINLREGQLNELKSKLNEIERTLADRETSLLSTDLRQEYQRQLQNIRTLRSLYEERARLAEVTRQGLARELQEHKLLYEAEQNKSKGLAAEIEQLETKVDQLQEIIDNKNMQISSCQDETSGLKAEMTVVNKLFSQVLLGYKTKQDLDKLVHRLEENHGILTHMAEKENGSEVSSALPKLLLELVSQVDEGEENTEPNTTVNDTTQTSDANEKLLEEQESQTSPNTTAEEIVENLPKVWRVLIELLSQQTIQDVSTNEKVTTCYKSVETKSGPVLVPSVSQTYIRLKNLIIEKLGLIKEVNRMKQLNSHLETRLEEQERRLCLVTTELSKTWHVVGRLRRHHQQLHTHEKILKYELQQKRKLLNELKEELEYCREKWEQAREKNSQSEKDWRKLRAEFSSRKVKSGSPSFNNSGESGYSDERPSDDSSESNDESEYVAEPLIRCKKKNKKSFETVFDSSADFNLAAEREDPVSDMLDVADLPLDTQDADEQNQKNGEPSISECSKSKIILKNDKTCEETEDEICDISHDDSCMEDPSNHIEHKDEATTSSSISQITSKSQQQLPEDSIENEQSTNYDKESLNKKDNHADNVNESTRFSAQACDTADRLINKSSSSSSNQSDTISSESDTSSTKAEIVVGINKLLLNNDAGSQEQTELNHTSLNSTNSCEDVTSNICKGGEVPVTDFKAILENVRKQNERLEKKDKRLNNLESSCSEVVDNITKTLDTGNQISKKLDDLHNKQQSDRLDGAQCSNNVQNSAVINDSQPSTSIEMDHEARFAARDIRLKRLEEQTKCLVNKVNSTATKGVKIHYKLQELHNIYGSENSRASTPSEDTEEKNDNENEQ